MRSEIAGESEGATAVETGRRTVEARVAQSWRSEADTFVQTTVGIDVPVAVESTQMLPPNSTLGVRYGSLLLRHMQDRGFRCSPITFPTFTSPPQTNLKTGITPRNRIGPRAVADLQCQFIFQKLAPPETPTDLYKH